MEDRRSKAYTITTKNKMILFTMIQGIAMLAFFYSYRTFGKQWMLSLAITLLTIFYHFAMRLTVGEMITVLFKNREFPQDRWGFRLYDFESGLYRKLRVKRWKMSMITAKPEQFDLRQVSLQELLHNMMQAELVHRIIMILSFVPLFFIIPFGEPLVFIITSMVACMMDSVFVIIQRYNRPRVVKLMREKEIVLIKLSKNSH